MTVHDNIAVRGFGSDGRHFVVEALRELTNKEVIMTDLDSMRS